MVMPERLAKLQRVACNRISGFRLVLDGVADPGNRAAVFRTAESFGILHIHIIKTPVDEAWQNRWHKLKAKSKITRHVSAGSDKWLKLHHHHSAAECVDELRQSAFRILCAKPEAPANDTLIAGSPTPLHQVDFSQPVALVFGNESVGVSHEMTRLADADFTIPMVGLTESLNISVAAAICMHWGRIARMRALNDQNGGGVMKHGDLSMEARESLVTDYINANGAEKRNKGLAMAADMPARIAHQKHWEGRRGFDFGSIDFLERS